ncbi:MAG: glycosyltransferase family 4 protein [Patescibacteria group bacterium]|nr:glycosyltransferase family 4 protein [Patescibacteria group bacterium]
MKILQVNKFHYPRGGADIYYLDLSENLRKLGHEVANFSMQHPLNLPSKWSKYFVSRVSFNENIWKYIWKIPGRLLYSLEAKRKFAAIIADFKPDIIHCHNIYHQLSPSILSAAKKAKIPVIIHLHDYALICPNHSLFTNNQICERCLSGNYWHCVNNKCVKNSRLASLLAAIELYLHNKIFNIYQKNTDIFISPSEFLKNLFISNKWPQNKFRVVANSFRQNLTSSKSGIKEDYFLYFGRLSQEKGVDLAIKALDLAPNLKLKIVGRGPAEDALKIMAKDNKNIEFIGWQDGAVLGDLISKAKAVLIPSRWLENFPLNALESISLGTPVIASNIGGLPEIINNTNGALVKVDDSKELTEVMMSIVTGSLSWTRENVKLSAEKYTPENNLQKVLKIYEDILRVK